MVYHPGSRSLATLVRSAGMTAAWVMNGARLGASVRMTEKFVAVLLNPLQRERNPLADADAHGGERALAAGLGHLVRGGQRQPRAGHSERMAERDRAAVQVQPGALDAETFAEGAIQLVEYRIEAPLDPTLLPDLLRHDIDGYRVSEVGPTR